MKLKERVLIAVLAGVVLLTVVLVLDVETRLTRTQKLTPSHARVQYNFRQRHLQKTINGSREGASHQLQVIGEDSVPHEQRLLKNQWAASEKEAKKTYSEALPKEPPHDPYDDLARAAQKAEDMYRAERMRRTHWNPTIGDLLGLELG